MRILEICPFSSGICGVWSRVKQEALELSKLDNEVFIFSSNIEKGTNKTASVNEEIGGIKIKRFPTNSLSKNVTYFDFDKELIVLNPDLVITHLFHPHSFKALEICKKLNIPCYLVTHAPFNVKRKFPLNIATSIWNWINQFRINNFTKIIAITKWEIPYLEELGIKQKKIIYIPNGIPKEFFTQKKSKEENKVLFLGRIAPVKKLETLIIAAKKIPEIEFSIVGLAEPEYFNKLNKLKPKNVRIYPPVYDLKNKIKLIDEHRIFVLPSKREAMPQSLIETMSRGKIVISSRTDGGKEIISEGKNGFLFEIGDANHLAKLIKENINGNQEVKKNAIASVQQYSWKNLIKKYLFLF